MELLVLAFLTAIAFIILMFKMGIAKFLRFGWQSDVLISAFLTAIFFGTMSGMMIGIMAGIFISIFLSIAKGISHKK